MTRMPKTSKERLLVSGLLIFLVVYVNQVIASDCSRRKDKTKIDFSLVYTFSVSDEAYFLFFRINLPKTIPFRQDINSVEFSPTPHRIFNSNGNRYAEYMFFEPEKQLEIRVDIKGELYDYDLSVARTLNTNVVVCPNDLSDYLKPERMIESDDTEIVKAAEKISAPNDVDLVQNIFNFVLDHMEPDASRPRSAGALYALRSKKGMCLDYCDLFVAICRAKGIPSRVVGGYIAEFDSKPKHAWAEAYLKDFGWVPFDPIWAEWQPINVRRNRFRNLEPNYIYFSNVRNDYLLDNQYIHFCFSKGGKFDVTNTVIFREPIEKVEKGSL